MGFKNTVVINQGGGNVPAGAAVMTDSFALLEVVAAESNAGQTDTATFAIEANYSETNAAQAEAVNVGISGYQESNPVPTEMRQSVLDRYATASSGGTNPANAQGSPNGSSATVKAGGLAAGSTTMTVDIVQPLTGAGSTPTFRGFYRNTGGLLDSFVQTLQYTQAASGTTQVTPTIAGTSQANYSTGTTGSTITLPANINDGDFGVIAVTYPADSTEQSVTPSGWTNAGAEDDAVQSSEARLHVIYKTMSVADRNTQVTVLTANSSSASVFFVGTRTHGGLRSVNNVTAVTNQQNISSASSDSSSLGIALHFVGMRIGSTINASPNISSNDGLAEIYESSDNGANSFYIQACYTETTGSSVPARSFSVLNAQNAKTNFATADVCTIVLEPGTVAAGGTQTINLPIGNFLTTPVEIPLTAVNNAANMRATFTHNAVVPLLGGQTDVDAISIRSTGVL
jgi:hypothetical protein